MKHLLISVLFLFVLGAYANLKGGQSGLAKGAHKACDFVHSMCEIIPQTIEGEGESTPVPTPEPVPESPPE